MDVKIKNNVKQTDIIEWIHKGKTRSANIESLDGKFHKCKLYYVNERDRFTLDDWRFLGSVANIIKGKFPPNKGTITLKEGEDWARPRVIQTPAPHYDNLHPQSLVCIKPKEWVKFTDAITMNNDLIRKDNTRRRDEKDLNNDCAT